MPDDDRLHRGQDRRADLALGDAVLGQHRALPLDRGAAVAAHRRHHERLRADRPDSVATARITVCDIGDAPAAGRDRDALAGPDALDQVAGSASASRTALTDVGEVIVRQRWRTRAMRGSGRSRQIHHAPPGLRLAVYGIAQPRVWFRSGRS